MLIPWTDPNNHRNTLRDDFLNAVYFRWSLTCTLGITNDLIDGGQPRAKPHLCKAKTKISPRSYQGLTKIWRRFYQDLTKVLPRSHQDLTKILPRSYQGLTKIWPRSDQDLTKVLPRSHQGLTKISPRSYQDLTKVWPRSYQDLTKILLRSYQDLQPGLPNMQCSILYQSFQMLSLILLYPFVVVTAKKRLTTNPCSPQPESTGTRWMCSCQQISKTKFSFQFLSSYAQSSKERLAARVGDWILPRSFIEFSYARLRELSLWSLGLGDKLRLSFKSTDSKWNDRKIRWSHDHTRNPWPDNRFTINITRESYFCTRRWVLKWFIGWSLLMCNKQ